MLALLALGQLASLATGGARRHAVLVALGIAVLLGASRLDYRMLRRLSPLVYAAAALLLLAVLALAGEQYGAKRWLAAGGVSVQPSELAKLALVLALATATTATASSVRTLAISLATLALPVLLVALEPDAGTALVMVAGWTGIVVARGVPWRLLGTLLAIALAVGPLLFSAAVPAYQRERLAVFFDPARDPLGSGFTLQQVELAFRSGGLTGRGILEPEDSVLRFLTARGSDFVFASTAEQLGALGAAAVLALFALFAWRGLEVARIASDDFGRLLAAGLTTMIVVQASLHVAVNLRLFPATGLPLPFVSAGGSAMLAMCFAVALLMSIAAHRPATSREQWSAERWR